MHNICPYPFSRITLGSPGFVPCCGGWLTEEFHEIPTGSDPWNGPAAHALRSHILKEDYRYCRTELCGKPIVSKTAIKPNNLGEKPISDSNWQAMLNNEIVMPEGPTAIAVNADIRCNLSCPSCRSKPMLTINAQIQKKINEAEKYLENNRKNIRTIKFADGEVFFSPWLRQLLKELSPLRFPNLNYVYVLSNGTLFDERNWRALQPGSVFIKAVSISIDAGDAETYAKVRQSDWLKLMTNLQWIAHMRKNQDFRYFQINFTVQKATFLSIPEFVDLGHELGVDNVKFTALMPWWQMGLNYQDEAVHLPTHSDHEKLFTVYKKIKHDPLVRWALPIPETQ